MGSQDNTAEEILARIAGANHSVVTRAQLLDAGVTDRQITRRLEKGALLPEYRGVYRVGHRAPSTEARYLAAVRACGDHAFLCGHAAAHLLGLLKGPPSKPEVLTLANRRIEGITTRRTRAIHPGDRTTWHGIPVTSPARTLVDLAASLMPDELARACHEAGVKHRTTPAPVEAVLARRPNTSGASALRAVLRGDARVSLSALERRFLSLIDEVGLPRPITNRPAGAHRVDCRWPDHNLTVELDSYRFHNSRYSWEQDRRRDREARARGDELQRFTYDDVFELPLPMLDELRRRLTASGRATGR